MGLAIAMPVGAIQVEMTKQGLKNGFMQGWAIALGGMTVDFLLLLTLYLGLASLFAIPFIQIPMWLIGAIFLMFLGYDSIVNADQDISLGAEKSNKSFLNSYSRGLLIAISPGNVVFNIAVLGAVFAHSYDTEEPSRFLIMGVGILLGITVHDLGHMTVVALTRKVMNRRRLKWVSVIAGLILILFAVYFLYEFVAALRTYLNWNWLQALEVSYLL